MAYFNYDTNMTKELKTNYEDEDRKPGWFPWEWWMDFSRMPLSDNDRSLTQGTWRNEPLTIFVWTLEQLDHVEISQYQEIDLKL